MIKHPRITWILVAHRTGAVLYQSPEQGAPLQAIQQWDHPLGRAKPSDLESDRPGRAFNRVGGIRHALSSEQTPTDHVDEGFVKLLLQRLEEGRLGNSFDSVVLVAPPHMLGQLRDGLSPQLERCVIASLDKDLARSDADDVFQRLRTLASI